MWIFLLIMLGVFIYPLILTLIVSLKTQSEVWANFFGFPAIPQFRNYPDAWYRGGIARALINSLYLATTTVLFQLGFANMVSFVLARVNIRINNFLYTFFALGIMIPIHAILLPIAQRAVDLGLSDSHLYLLAVYVGGGLPSLVFLMVSYMKSIPSTVEEAATIDGCSLSQVYFNVTLPMSQPILVTTAIIAFISSYNELPVALVLLKSTNLRTLPLALSTFVGFNSVNFPQLTAAIVTAILPTITLYVFFQSKIQKGLTSGAIKG